MALTRPAFNNLNTNLTTFSDPITITNFGNVANRDIGELFDRSQGGGSNVAIIWRESIQGFNLVYTSSTGKAAGNLTVTANANLTVGNLVASNSANVTSITATEYVYGQFIRSTNRSGDEGGELQLANAVTNTTLSTGVTVDVFQNKFRIFETGGTSRGGYFDISSLAAGAGTNLGAGSVTPPGGTATQVQFNNGGSSFGGATSLLYQANGQVIANASITSTSASTGVLIVPNGGIGVSGNVYCGQVYSTNNGNGTNYAVGDDVWLGDINLANTMVLKGQQDGSQGYLIFGNGTQLSLGRSGSGPLTYQGAFTANGGLQNTPIGNSTASTGSFTSVTASGQITVNSGNNATAIVNGGTSGTGNIGASGATFNTIFAKATTAQYADLAENYIADAEYAPGTVVIFGGEQEITTTTESHDTRVAGIISTNPAYLMNSGCDGLPVALQGRVPCQVKGPVCKGDLLVTSSTPGVAQKLNQYSYAPGCVVGKSLENFESDEQTLIEVVVGRL